MWLRKHLEPDRSSNDEQSERNTEQQQQQQQQHEVPSHAQNHQTSWRPPAESAPTCEKSYQNYVSMAGVGQRISKAGGKWKNLRKYPQKSLKKCQNIHFKEKLFQKSQKKITV